MIRKVIQIDENKCIGCSLCAKACKQSAIEMVDGKAKVMHDDYCDGIGNCLPVCPVGAISFSDKDVVAKPSMKHAANSPCKGTATTSINKKSEIENSDAANSQSQIKLTSQLSQWPVQIKLAPTSATYFDKADILIAADCTAYAYANFHADFIKGKITLIGCPKLDNTDYSEKLTAILANNDIKSITVARMEVPCCTGIANMTKSAAANCGKDIPLKVVTISLDGEIL